MKFFSVDQYGLCVVFITYKTQKSQKGKKMNKIGHDHDNGPALDEWSANQHKQKYATITDYERVASAQSLLMSDSAGFLKEFKIKIRRDKDGFFYHPYLRETIREYGPGRYEVWRSKKII